MGMLFRAVAPKPVKKARRVAHPVSLVAPKAAKRAKAKVVNAAKPVGATKRAAKGSLIRTIRNK
jgi:hypothetical protein